MEWMTTATTSVLGVMTTVLDTITGNAILAMCFVAGCILPIGIKTFKKVKSASGSGN